MSCTHSGFCSHTFHSSDEHTLLAPHSAPSMPTATLHTCCRVWSRLRFKTSALTHVGVCCTSACGILCPRSCHMHSQHAHKTTRTFTAQVIIHQVQVSAAAYCLQYGCICCKK